jgi:hypothetical protein
MFIELQFLAPHEPAAEFDIRPQASWELDFPTFPDYGHW